MRRYLLLSLFASTAAFAATTNPHSLYQRAPELPGFHSVRDAYMQYYYSGQYTTDQANIANSAIAYIDQRASNNNGKEKLAVVFDLDETLLSNWGYMSKASFPQDGPGLVAWINKGEDTLIRPTYQLYKKALKNGMTVFFITGRTEDQRQVTVDNLKKVGIKKWQHLYLFPKGKYKNATAFKSAIRKQLVAKGYDIVFSMGDQYSDLCGGYSDKTFKLPNPFYYIPGCSNAYLKKHQYVFKMIAVRENKTIF